MVRDWLLGLAILVHRIGFDAKGDVPSFDPFAWYAGHDGTWVPRDPID